MKNDDFPRRNKLWLMTQAEVMIYLAMGEVEKMGADVKLTEAVTLLAKAKDAVADFVDNIKEDYDKIHDVHYYVCPDCGRTALLNDTSPIWYHQEVTVLNYHWMNNGSDVICKTPFNEITKEEFFKLTFPQSEGYGEIKPSI
jgi:hypothetical protein